MKRRTLLTTGGGSLLMFATLPGCQQAAPAVAADSVESSRIGQTGIAGQTLDKFGLQLSTVTNLMLADFEGTLRMVAEIGYQQVEFSAMGFLGRSVERIQSLLGELGLAAPVGRITPKLPDNFFTLPRAEARNVYLERAQPRFLLDNVAHSLEAAVALEQNYLVLPALGPDNFTSLDQVQRNIELLNRAGELCAQQGVVFGYHNHNWELAPVAGVIPFDLMLQETDPAQVTFQLDAYWVKKGGGDLSDYLRRFAGRFVTCHLKDIDAAGDFADVGSGLIDFPRFTREAIAQGAKYFFVERDNPPAPEDSVRRSYAYVAQMEF